MLLSFACQKACLGLSVGLLHIPARMHVSNMPAQRSVNQHLKVCTTGGPCKSVCLFSVAKCTSQQALEYCAEHFMFPMLNGQMHIFANP